jgi:hypothetical protein
MICPIGRCVVVAVLALSLAACAAFQNAPVRPIQLTTANAPSAYPIDGVTTATLLPASDYDLVTTRPNPTPNGGPPVFCAQPSPDLATAFGETVQGGASGGGGGVTAGLNGELANTQSITALAGRTAGVVALRDGLYSACQAYANGMIGKDAYALILSQYGNLLVALASGGASGSETAAISAAQIQQQAVQAMLVACLTHYDSTSGGLVTNAMLETWCPAFMADFMKAVPALLKPVAVTAPAPPKTPTPAATPATSPVQKQKTAANPAASA